MNYLEIKLVFSQPEPWKEVFTALLGDLGCESFSDGETEEELLAYIPEDLFDKEQIDELLTEHPYEVKIQYSIQEVKTENWNVLWESNYSPVLIADKCYIRAPFHKKMEHVDYEIEIEPKMSFGTAHHETTAMMIEYLLEEPVAQKSVLDMGAGTGVLAILSYMKGAFPVTAIDNDEWAYLNNIENNSRNNADQIVVKLGDAETIKGDLYQIIIANINRNILLRDLPEYEKCLEKNGIIFLSGFYVEEDLALIREKCESLGLYYVSHKEKNKWCSAKFIKH
ncbi:MAG TPA: 50S ribosomal protein L11 methyltransferase [Bacteroidales bacterium]|nr:50S ribosomal protein L11 methyltransferase [Bacteroidales bacterium]HPS71618.1 50S ribosomal protein L11 methyltransferase [Bacteroidales bacterium]